MNRKTRRALARAQGQPAASARKDRIAMGAALLQEMIAVNRVDAVGRLLGILFEQDIGDGVFRLRGLGGPQGIASKEFIDQAAREAAYGALLVPQEMVGEEDKEDNSETQQLGPN